MSLKPSNFKIHPWDSIFKNNETETIARNIMVILARTSDTWRSLSWNEYVAERTNDGAFTEWEKPYFDKVIDYTVSPETAKLFSPAWKEIYTKEMNQ